MKIDHFYYASEEHKYFLDGQEIPHITGILQDSGLVNYTGIPQDILEKKADIGRKTHTACELYDQDNLILETLHLTLKAYLQGWIQFIEDFKPEFIEIEKPRYSEKYRFAGKPDRVAIITSNLSIVEIKTSSTIERWVGIQLAGQSILWDEEKKVKEQIRKRIAVQLLSEPMPKINKQYKVMPFEEATDRAVFMSALTIANYKKGGRNGKGND